MSQHWNPRPPRGGRRAPAFYRPRRRRGGLWDAVISLGVLGGLGLAIVQFAQPAPAPAPVPTYGDAPVWSDPVETAEARIPSRPRPARQSYDGARLRVIDGDTFDIDGMRVRVADIDTPELRGACPYERDLAVRAADRMEALLAAGAFDMEPGADGRDSDRYGRKLRVVTRDGRSLGAQLVEEGLARPWTGRRQPWC
jgi:endonuclease YncB( thermonuclease family)